MEKKVVVKVDNGQLVTSSRNVAFNFEKRHSNVIRAIERIIDSAQNWAELFYPTQYKDNSGKENKMYFMNRDGFSLLVMGFTGKKALEWKLKYIQAFNEMEKELKEKSPALPDFSNPAEAARAWADQWEKRQTAEKALEAAKPAIVFADSVSISETDIPISSLAKILSQNGIEIGRNRLFEWLRVNGYLMKEKRAWNQPTQSSLEKGLFRLSETAITTGYRYTPVIRFTTYVTGKGQRYFVEKFLGKKVG